MTGLEIRSTSKICFRRPRHQQTDSLRVVLPREIAVASALFSGIVVLGLLNGSTPHMASGWRWLLTGLVGAMSEGTVHYVWMSLARASRLPRWVVVIVPWASVDRASLRGPSLIKLWRARPARRAPETLF
jgi:hypothetical protein